MKYFTSYLPSYLLFLFIYSSPLALAAADYAANAESAIKVLNDKWYSTSTGLYNGLWWNSANAMTTIADLGLIDDSFKSTAEQIISTTYANAPGTNGGTWLNDYYDDEGWWALGWIAAYDLTGNLDYLNTAISIFDDMTTGWGTPCSSGGLWWSKDRTYISAISNELFLSVAAHLANRVPSSKTNSVAWARAEWDWFSHSGVINSANTINDGINYTTCKNNQGTVFTYNQGVILGGLVELSAATGDPSYLDEANTLANAALKALTDSNGILTESGGIEEDSNLAQFKGIFVRNLAALHKASPDAAFSAFLTKNADAIWNSDRDDPTGFLGPHWQGPFATATAPSQSSAIDCLVAAAAVS
ncbi:glycoside hydrolase family 76 protein [Lepidopterella palustris CBS 459.81]|uniref:Glycoside hydrolase family 76 protein n=1 Tax=Lepidopterella palustris CBS 459.81 TaxID=1314670 RepID=A0A8E2E9S1_9PEZI|nr:glycoside hydrolase family 76 protein [Lepidopterella palustris CBS 459.81]